MVPCRQRKLNLSNRTGWRESSGTVAIVTGICLLVIMGMAGLALDLGQFYVVKSELQRAADAGALAGARALFLPPPAPTSPQCSQAQTKAWQIAQANVVQGATPTVSTPPSYALPYGHWDWPSKTFTPGCSSVLGTFTNAVTVRTTLSNVSLMFMGAFGYGPKTLTADAMAAMAWVGKLSQGAGFVLAIARAYIRTEPTVLQLDINDPQNKVGTWYTKAPLACNNSRIRGYLGPPLSTPAIKLGEMVNLNTGSFASSLAFVQQNYINVTVFCPVVEVMDYNRPVAVTGFTAFKITAVNTTAKWIRGVALKAAGMPGGGAPGDTPAPADGLLTAPMLVQ